MRAASLFCCLIIFSGLAAGGPSLAYADNIPPKANAFLRAYPNFFTGYKENTLLCRDGSGLTFDDGRKKTFEQLLSDADPEDELYQNYPTGPASYGAPPVNFDPGRYRCAALLKKCTAPLPAKSNLISPLFPGCLIPLTRMFASQISTESTGNSQRSPPNSINSRPKTRNTFSRLEARLTGDQSPDPIS